MSHYKCRLFNSHINDHVHKITETAPGSILNCFEAFANVTYLFSFMVGAAHYGLIVGRRLQDPRKDKNIYTRKIRRNWHEYGLPKPAYLTSTNMSQRTCLICLIQFVVAPDLMKIVAFNHDATAWGQLNGGEGPGALYITFLPSEDESDLLHISSPQDLQSSLRTDTFQRQEHLYPKVRKSWPLYTLPKPA
jgi:hypothetical protein